METTYVAILPIVLLALLTFGIILVILVAVMGGRNRTPSGPPRPSAIPSAPVNREARVAILRRLAERQITVDEAEARLSAMGNPVPAGIASAPPATSSNRGCLMAGLIAFGLISVIAIGVILISLLAYRSASSTEYRMHITETVPQAQPNVEIDIDEASHTEAEVTDETIETWEEETE